MLLFFGCFYVDKGKNFCGSLFFRNRCFSEKRAIFSLFSDFSGLFSVCRSVFSRCFWKIDVDFRRSADFRRFRKIGEMGGVSCDYCSMGPFSAAAVPCRRPTQRGRGGTGEPVILLTIYL
ncbi:hypothetical protein [uncultured Alistipes sp.]|uniref:hypothetical protein n=1 Tax=uncultured Alistipes sp. TaxID=538949 RepID=UPI002624286C|nr:hypothetical protein [uncultured Alistipes sp.]